MLIHENITSLIIAKDTDKIFLFKNSHFWISDAKLTNKY